MAELEFHAPHGCPPPMASSLLWSLSDEVSSPSATLDEVQVLSGYSHRPLGYRGECENPFRAHVICFLNSNVSVCLRQFQCIAQAVLKLNSPASTL